MTSARHASPDLTTAIASMIHKHGSQFRWANICKTSCTCRYSTSNTRSGIESCGILAGSLREKQGIFVISTLIIPKQEGTSDTVQALNEEEIFDVQDKRALYPLGWIHTHPTQTCFLSSVDVHTQCGYQVSSNIGLAAVHAHQP